MKKANSRKTRVVDRGDCIIGKALLRITQLEVTPADLIRQTTCKGLQINEKMKELGGKQEQHKI